MPVDADRPAAVYAGPTVFLVSDEFPDPAGPDRFKVLQHAHAIVLPVPGIQLHEPPAGKRGAGKAVFSFKVCTGAD
jgi:hypothetical protein